MFLRSSDALSSDPQELAKTLNRIKTFAGVGGADFTTNTLARLAARIEATVKKRAAARASRLLQGAQQMEPISGTIDDKRDRAAQFGNKGMYDVSKLNVNDAKAMLALRLMYRQPLADLSKLLRQYYQPDFPDLVEEMSESTLRAIISEHDTRMV